MSPRSFLLVLVQCVFFVSVLGAATTRKKLDWSCRNISPPQNFTLNSLVGDWYLTRTVERQVNHDSTSLCHLLKFTQPNSTKISVAYGGQIGGFNVRDTKKPWILVNESGDKTMNVIFAASDGSKLVATYCLPNSIGKGYYLYSKKSPVSAEEITDIERIVDAAGGIRSDKTETYYTWEVTKKCGK